MKRPAPSLVAQLRLAAQRLVGARHAAPEGAVRSLLAVQAQDPSGSRWAVAQRVEGATDAAVGAAYDAGVILRTHVLRPTWHMVVPADLRWLLTLTAPRVQQLSAPYYRKLGLDDAALARAERVIAQALARGRHATRAELGAALAKAGLPLSGQALGYVMIHAELEQRIVSGARQGKQHTYASFDQRVPPAAPVPRDEALAELARRFVAGHGPALPEDLAGWATLTLGDARRAFAAASLDTLEVDGKRYAFVEGPPVTEAGAGAVHLLPNYDELLAAFKDRAHLGDPRLTAVPGVDFGELLFAHLIAIGGRVVGGWRREAEGRAIAVRARTPVALTAAERSALARAAAAYGACLEAEVRLTLAGID